MKEKFRNHQRGFTLVEIMVVVIVLGILAAVVLPNLSGKRERAEVAKARSDITEIQLIIENFNLDMRRYPYPEEGLTVLRNPPQTDDADNWRGPYALRPIPNDPWGNPYRFLAPAPNGIDAYGIESYGKDREPGGEGFDKDINSWSNYEDEEF